MDDVVSKRILLAKEFYLHGVELAKNNDPLSKMLAIHNFHIAIEITVKSILLKYDIRNDRTLNIDFESMLSEVDRHQDFKERGLKLPYRQEIRNLNQMRNLVQHHAIEPDQSSMDDWRLFSKQFLEKTFMSYFDIDFDNVNRMDFVADDGLKKYMNLALLHISNRDFASASCCAAAAFEYASLSISSFIPESSASFFVRSSLYRSGIDFEGLENAFRKTHKRIDESEHFAALLASGLNLADYNKFKEATPFVTIMFGGNPHFETVENKEFGEETTKWLAEFVISTLIKWQQLGLSPKIPDHLASGAHGFIDEETARIKT
jgi:hypothetical protein